MGTLIYKYDLFWQEVSVKSLILRWPLRPVGLLLLSTIVSKKDGIQCKLVGHSLHLILLGFPLFLFLYLTNITLTKWLGEGGSNYKKVDDNRMENYMKYAYQGNSAAHLQTHTNSNKQSFILVVHFYISGSFQKLDYHLILVILIHVYI